MLFCGNFIKVYVWKKLLKYTVFWQTYGKNKTVQFFASQCRLYKWTNWSLQLGDTMDVGDITRVKSVRLNDSVNLNATVMTKILYCGPA